MSAVFKIRDTDWNMIYANRVRAIEELYADIHADLLEWGRWGKDRFPGKPRLMLSGVWTLPGETDPDRDPEAVPEGRPAKIDERMVVNLDARINHAEFPSIWATVLKVNYIPPKLKRGVALHVLPEHQRPHAAKLGAESFIEQLSLSLDYLRTELNA